MEEIDVKNIRKSLRITQAMLASKLQVDTATVSRWERRLARPSRRAVRELLRLKRKAGL